MDTESPSYKLGVADAIMITSAAEIEVVLDMFDIPEQAKTILRATAARLREASK